jgi:predicted CXXCH cytochrome family protein
MKPDFLITGLFAVFFINLATAEINYVGAQGCRACHSEIFSAWEKDVHSSAYTLLEEGDAQDNPVCLPCHTTGFVAADDTMFTYLEKNVTCENCHGPGDVHVKSSGKASIDMGDNAEVCLRCHVSEWSPAFDFDQYMERGVH